MTSVFPLVILDGVMERLFKVDHETNRSIENCHVLFFCDVFNNVQETGVHPLFFASDKTIEYRVGNAIFQESMEHKQLCEGEDGASESSVSLYQRCCREELKRAFQTKDDDVLSVAAQQWRVFF